MAKKRKDPPPDVKKLIRDAGWRCGYHSMLTQMDESGMLDELAKALVETRRIAAETGQVYDEGIMIDEFKASYTRAFGKEYRITWSF